MDPASGALTGGVSDSFRRMVRSDVGPATLYRGVAAGRAKHR